MGLGLFLFGVLAFMGGMGMGDVKLCAAIGAWVGPKQLFVALVLTGIVGGVMAVIWAAMGGFLGELFSGTGDLIFGWRKRRRERIGTYTCQSQRAEDALCAGNSNRNADFVFCRLRDETIEE